MTVFHEQLFKLQWNTIDSRIHRTFVNIDGLQSIFLQASNIFLWI